jgi:MFS family permease
VVGALLLAKFRLRFSPDQLLIAAGATWGIVTGLLGWLHNFPLAAIAMLVGGVGWVSEMSSFNVAAQTVLPGWVRARGLALYLLVFQGGMAVASMLWGTVAEHYGIRVSLYAAGASTLLSLFLVKRFPIRLGQPRDVTHSGHWPEPVFTTPPHPERGPVLVTIEYEVDPEDRDAFTAAMRDMGRIRRRDGAIRWGTFQNAAFPSRYLESFLVASWAEHLRQHERATLGDVEVAERVKQFHRGTSPPTVKHWLAPE